ncbi:ATP-binding protein [Actinoplanes sp. NPDC051513]|uniref:ATP-binding protein n=1 Tax=Actinoplanes sp. NPDC051513 TaxID=3363908 RepID=UPI00378B1620
MVQVPVQTQVAIRRAELASIIESSHDAIVGMTASGVISSCNAAALRLYGFAEQEFVGASVEILIPPQHRAAEAAILQRVAAGEDMTARQTQRLHRDGTVLTVSLTTSPILGSTGAIVGAATIAHLVDEPPGVAGGLDTPASQHHVEAHGRAHLLQPQVQEGDRQAADDPQDRTFQDLMDAEYAHERVQVHEAQDRFQAKMGARLAQERMDVHDAEDRFQKVMGAERAKERVRVAEAQDRFQLRDGEERAQELVEVENAQDRFQAVMDSGRARAQHDREHLQAQLHQGQRLELLGQLAGGVAHDFNNLLGVILNYAEFVGNDLAERGPELIAAHRDVGQIQRAAERASDLTHQLLAFARREIVQPQVLDLNHIVTDMEQLLRRTIGTDILLRTDLAEGLWPVLADAGRIEQVLLNLAVNARDAMSGGGTLGIDTANVIVDIDADALLTAGQHVRIRVSDTGTGMPDAVKERVFEPFFTTKAEGAGTGLGLSTVYGIIAEADGTITIHSIPGAGTTMTILVPVTDEIADPEPDAVPYERTPSGETVLMVEDQEALREVTERIFTRSGYHVITAAGGPEAVAFAAGYDGDIHLLVTDVVMPDMLGKEVAEKIRELKPDIEVLFMSGYAQPVLASQGRLDRGVHLIEKPFSASAIIEKAGRILNGHFAGFRTIQPSETAPPETDDPEPHNA